LTAPRAVSFRRNTVFFFVIPTKAGIHQRWIPAFELVKKSNPLRWTGDNACFEAPLRGAPQHEGVFAAIDKMTSP
jgi:hypothetical protein